MFIAPLKSFDEAKGYLKDNKKGCIIFLQSESADGYLELKNKTKDLVLILLEPANTISYNAITSDELKKFKENKEILIDDGVAFFVNEECTIAQKGYDPEEFIKNIGKFRIPAPVKPNTYANNNDYACNCCVIL
ncbi:hypothetical protein IWW38_000391 [Coemansia aciculifera]|uniref:Uncharacterized protein n=1 Tax=Coemansia aciculifera TaxID=417176 RepID=A0ACC1MB74_9FUNG|nr:hypothetical protein IWW38_000391 [Coemansia aciculifera]